VPSTNIYPPSLLWQIGCGGSTRPAASGGKIMWEGFARPLNLSPRAYHPVEGRPSRSVALPVPIRRRCDVYSQNKMGSLSLSSHREREKARPSVKPPTLLFRRATLGLRRADLSPPSLGPDSRRCPPRTWWRHLGWQNAEDLSTSRSTPDERRPKFIAHPCRPLHLALSLSVHFTVVAGTGKWSGLQTSTVHAIPPGIPLACPLGRIFTTNPSARGQASIILVSLIGGGRGMRSYRFVCSLSN